MHLKVKKTPTCFVKTVTNTESAVNNLHVNNIWFIYVPIDVTGQGKVCSITNLHWFGQVHAQIKNCERGN